VRNMRRLEKISDSLIDTVNWYVINMTAKIVVEGEYNEQDG